MSLASKNWKPISLHNVVAAWLRAERAEVNKRVTVSVTRLLDQPDFNDPSENRERLRLLYRIRNLFVLEIPPDTAWFEVDSLTDAELPELYAINHHNWTDAADRNELAKVAVRKNLILRGTPSAWDPPILWGHDKYGPFTILEGNHRLAAYVASGKSSLSIPVLVGLSMLACHLHRPDNSPPLIRDLLGYP